MKTMTCKQLGGPCEHELHGDSADAVVFGHSHLPLHERAADGFQIFNPGSPTERRRAPAHTMGLVQVEGSSIEFRLIR